MPTGFEFRMRPSRFSTFQSMEIRTEEHLQNGGCVDCTFFSLSFHTLVSGDNPRCAGLFLGKGSEQRFLRPKIDIRSGSQEVTGIVNGAKLAEWWEPREILQSQRITIAEGNDRPKVGAPGQPPDWLVRIRVQTQDRSVVYGMQP